MTVQLSRKNLKVFFVGNGKGFAILLHQVLLKLGVEIEFKSSSMKYLQKKKNLSELVNYGVVFAPVDRILVMPENFQGRLIRYFGSKRNKVLGNGERFSIDAELGGLTLLSQLKKILGI